LSLLLAVGAAEAADEPILLDWKASVVSQQHINSASSNLILMAIPMDRFRQLADDGLVAIDITRAQRVVSGEAPSPGPRVYGIRGPKSLKEITKTQLDRFVGIDWGNCRIQVFGRRHCLLLTVAEAQMRDDIVLEAGCVVVYYEPAAELWDASVTEF
jgi:hypothetical protein